MSNEHYDAGGIPVIDVIRAKLTQEQYEGYLLGNIIKYSLRLNFKNAKAQDAAKLAEYACWLDESHWKESPLAHAATPEEQQRPQRANESWKRAL